MRPMFTWLATVVLSLAVGLAGALAGTTEQHIQNLKDKDPAVRAEAAKELGCS